MLSPFYLFQNKNRFNTFRILNFQCLLPLPPKKKKKIHKIFKIRDPSVKCFYAFVSVVRSIVYPSLCKPKTTFTTKSDFPLRNEFGTRVSVWCVRA